ncbi:MAG: hypothetical protein MH825_09035 [Cyanobacteria bacterium]|nr:hypothetical protein [Cyanobacteriota bacterium]
MKQFRLREMMPNVSQFYTLTRDQISTLGTQSISYKLVHSLFQSAENTYRTLDFHTDEGLSRFKESGRYLTAGQERDLVWLVSNCISNIQTITIREMVMQDAGISEAERAVLLMTIQGFQDTVQATIRALGQPKWIE